MYRKKTSLIMGFHGCDIKIRDAVINGEELNPSINSYDWLGHGLYFWEADPVRAMEWAKQSAHRNGSSITTPAVLGAVIDLGNCLDLTNRQSIPALAAGYEWLCGRYRDDMSQMPQNRNVGNNMDLLRRDLDCSVIEILQEQLANHPELGIEPADSVRGLFIEGREVYPNSGFKEKTHIQICVRNPNCIKGYFLPRKLNKDYPTP